MNPRQLLWYLAQHGGTAVVGTHDSIISALTLEKQGLVTRVAQEGRNYRFNITAEGSAAVRAPLRVKVVRGASTAGRAVQSYATAFKDEQSGALTENQLLNYMKAHGGQAVVGNRGTLDSASRLERTGAIMLIGQQSNGYVYGLRQQMPAQPAPEEPEPEVKGKEAGINIYVGNQGKRKEQEEPEPAPPEHVVSRMPTRPQPQSGSSFDSYFGGDSGIGGSGYLGINPSDYPGLQYSPSPRPVVPIAPHLLQKKHHPPKHAHTVKGKKYRRVR